MAGERPPAERGPAASSFGLRLADELVKISNFQENPDFWSKKKVEIWPIWTHHELRKACPVIFLNLTGVEKS